MIIIGKIGNPYGILGWIHVISFTELKENIFKYFPWNIEKINIKIKKSDVIKYKLHIKNFIIQFKNIHTRTQAYKFANKNIFIKNDQLPQLGNKNYYWKDIKKCTIFNLKKKIIGPIINILENRVYNILEVWYKEKNKTIYIPFIQPNFIKKINISKKIIISKWV
ncbi:ribosome maturation factor RimM [Buchnera aphidicola]|uniref:Ribosome maturation factor RimM n=1 Tax=Buchnera aphidicola (Cinara strobi) TaxID=1921549 RepID=A0A3B1E0V3_9GAMM|nr:ribosome maturation factor RimM [Buchnera aphidicola]VAX76655.1 Ribosome maturation factor RimM [Buchnera aphidicola (Cinara strobi)]